MAGRQRQGCVTASTEQRGGMTAEKLAGKGLGELVLAEGARRAGPGADRRRVFLATNALLNELREVTTALLPNIATDSQGRAPAGVLAEIDLEDCGLSLKKAVRKLEAALIAAALARTETMVEAARLLEISARALQYKRKDYGIDSRSDDNQITAEDLSVKKATVALEERLIGAALVERGGNVKAAAKLLEISVKALSYKIKDYGLTELLAG